MKITKVKSGSVYEDKLSYSRVVALGDWILVSNTAGRNYATREIADNAPEQARRALHNIAGALAAVGSNLRDVVRSRVAIPDPAAVPAVGEVLGEAFRGIDPVITLTCTPLASPDYLFEIEVTAYRGAGDAPTDRLTIAL